MKAVVWTGSCVVVQAARVIRVLRSSMSSLEDDLMRMFGSERIASLMDKMGYKEGEVIQHSMITKSIERAQKKVEENNFGIRKRLLEYDDVMNKQRNVVYKKRNHALFGERLALDLDNAFYSVAEGLVNSLSGAEDYEGFKLAGIVNFGMDTAITEEEFLKGRCECSWLKNYMMKQH